MELKGRCKSCFEVIGEIADCPFCGYYEGKDTSSSVFIKPGLILENKYLVGGALGQGGFGITYLAWDINLNIKLAIKEYFPQDFATRIPGSTEVSAHSGSLGSNYAYGLDKFLQEARTIASLESHPNVVSIRDFFKANGTAYFVMYYVEGITLKDYLKNSGGIVSFDQAKKIIIPVLDALKEVHMANILHRDVSPDNIFINKKGQVILLDFGAARQALEGKGKNLSVILKPGYAPEEQYRSKGIQGPWTDIYATAATLYHLVTGSMPPESVERLGNDRLLLPSHFGVDLSEQEEEAVLKALAVSAADRFQSVGEFRDALIGDSEVSKSIIYYEPQILPSDGISKNTDSFITTKLLKQPVLIGIATAFFIGVALFIIFFSGILNRNSEELNFVASTTIIENGEAFVLLDGSIRFQEGTYAGQHHDGIPYGTGIWSHPDGLVYDGEWKNGMAHGYGKMIWPNGDRYEGEWKEDMFNGQGVLFLANGEKYEGEWFNDMRHGQGSVFYPDGDQYTGDWKGNLFYGQGKMTWADGRQFEGEFKDNMRDGFGIMVWPDGTKYKGNWQKDFMNGYGVLTLPGGEIYEGDFVNSKMHGHGKFTFTDGSEVSGLWQDGDFISGE